jgi:outer membrane receptor protein involved in Fe transport
MTTIPAKYSACALAVMTSLSGAAQAQDEGVEEIRVTGTRIVRSGVDTPVPVTMVSAEELDQIAPGTMIESLITLPQFYDNIAPDQITGGQTGGGANLNLRGAGVNRSLILLDGRRVVPSNRFGTVDISAFPEELVSRVETITGGASASYGTDAVAGVVNFILDTDFTGFKLHTQAGSTMDGDGENFEVGAAWGGDIGERMHIIASAEGYSADAIDTFDALKDRGFYRQVARLTGPPGGPAEITRPYVSPTNFTNGGIFIQPGSALDHVEFLPDGTYRTLPFSGVGQLTGGCNCQAEPTQSPTYGVDSDEQIAPEYDRLSAFVHFGYDISETLNFYVQGLFGNTENSDRRESIALLGPWQGAIFANNAFLPAPLAQQMIAENRQSAGFAFFGLNTPDSPLGDSRQITDNDLASTTIGFEMDLTRDGFLDGWKLEGYYQHGKNVQDYKTENGIRVDRLFFAMDAVIGPQGTPVCNISLVNPTYFSDCAPVNLFGGVQMISPQAAAYIVDDGKTARQDTQQDFFEVVFTGDLGEGWAGPIAAAFGASYRQEDLWQKTLDPSDEFPALVDGTLLSDVGILPAGIRGLIPQGHPSGLGIPGLRHVPNGFLGDANSSSVLFSSLREISGGFDVREVFSEFSIPLLTDKSLARELDVNLAARWADYSGSGSVQAWKVGLNWQATDSVRVRATRSLDTRAATLRERFDQTRGGTNVRDPENNNATVTTASFSGGNPNVDPEEADTITVGIVFQPTALEGFSISADWYEIDVSDAIAQLMSQDVVNGCFAGAQDLCQYVHRDPVTNTIVRVDNLFINLQNQRLSGTDLELNYNTSLSNGALGWRLFLTQLNENSLQNPGAPTDNRAGQINGGPGGFSLPEYKVTTNVTYARGPFSLFLQGRWIDSGILDRTRTVGVNIDDNSVDSVFYTDLNARYTIEGQREWEIFFNVTNLFDEDPPYAPAIVGRTGTSEFNTALHDVLGRRFAAGFRLSL